VCLSAYADRNLLSQFLPIIGNLVVSRIRGTLPPEQADAWSLTRPRSYGGDQRGIMTRQILDVAEMAVVSDLIGDEGRP
jgi:hypothetical protein